MTISCKICISLIPLLAMFSIQHVYADGHQKLDKDSKIAKDDVKYRKSSFQMIKYHFKPLGDMAKGKILFDAVKAKANADAIVTLGQFPIYGFQKKSLTDASRALPKIWENLPDFQNKMSDFQKAAEQLSKNADSLEKLKSAFSKTAKTCKSCHDNYRKKKKK